MPTPMAFQPNRVREVVLWLLWDPSISPKWLFEWVLEPFRPWDGHGWVLVPVVPLTHANDVFWCGRDLANGTGLGGLAFFVSDGRLVPRADVVGLPG